MLSTTHGPLVVAALLCAVAAVTDLRGRIIPNWLTLPALGLALLLHVASGGLMGAVFASASALACFVPSYLLFVRGALGGGDVKLFAALGALLGARLGLELELCAFMLVTGYALWSMAWHGRLIALLRASYKATLHMVAPARFARPVPTEGSAELPMGGAILLACLAMLARSAL